jgi:hypothetical protein
MEVIKMEQLKIINNDDFNLAIKEISNGVYQFRLKEIAESLNQYKIDYKNGKEYKRIDLSRIKKWCNSFGIQAAERITVEDFVPEHIFYRICFKADNDVAEKVQIYAAQVLTQLRIKGCIILDYAKEETIDFERKFGAYRIRKTFRNSHNVFEDYKQFKELSVKENEAKRLPNKARVKLCKIITDELEAKLKNNNLTMRASEILAIRELISDIKDDIIKLHNYKNGREKGLLTAEIQRLKKEEITKENLYLVRQHPYSDNARYDKDGKCTDWYWNWIKNFNYKDMPPIAAFKDIDFNLPVKIYLCFTVVDKNFDISSFTKTAMDRIASHYKLDDKLWCPILIEPSTVLEGIQDYKKGEIYFTIRQWDIKGEAI